ncbi:uncharacterized protein LOC115238174 [Formica exsecta]|uniref:uncharacterized protein LOC115238174 n=1 Tax=Formica exsecta TaxID=72781 RepID=UPI001141E374|nr:uncharacterized protein LOC115238174 [Formica exsecta]
MEKQYEYPNIDNSSDSDEKSSSRFIPRRVLETSVKQASPSWIDHVRNNGDQVLVDDDTRINVTKCNYLFKTETMNLSGSSTTELSPTELDATDIARSNRSKSALELLQYLQECIQKIDSELKNNEEPKESLDMAMNTISNYISKLDTLRIQKLAKKWLEIRNNFIYGRRNFRKRNSDSTTNSSKSGEESKDYQNKEKENREMSQKIDELSSFRFTDALVKNLEVGKSIDSMTNIHDIAYIPSTSITDDQPETTDNKEYLDPVNSAELISTPKYALELKSQSSQKCIQKIESDNKSKNYEGSYSMESSPAELSCMDQLKASNCICEQMSKKIDICHGYNELLLLIFEADLYTNYKLQIPRENNSDSTTETSIEQASSNRTDYIRNNGDQVLADDDCD